MQTYRDWLKNNGFSLKREFSSLINFDAGVDAQQYPALASANPDFKYRPRAELTIIGQVFGKYLPEYPKDKDFLLSFIVYTVDDRIVDCESTFSDSRDYKGIPAYSWSSVNGYPYNKGTKSLNAIQELMPEFFREMEEIQTLSCQTIASSTNPDATIIEFFETIQDKIESALVMVQMAYGSTLEKQS